MLIEEELMMMQSKLYKDEGTGINQLSSSDQYDPSYTESVYFSEHRPGPNIPN